MDAADFAAAAIVVAASVIAATAAVAVAVPAAAATAGVVAVATADAVSKVSVLAVVASAADTDLHAPLTGRRMLASGTASAESDAFSYDGLLKLLRQHATAVNSGVTLARSEGKASSTHRRTGKS